MAFACTTAPWLEAPWLEAPWLEALWLGALLLFAALAQGSSSWPRCRQVFAKALMAPSSPRTMSAPPAPVSTASWSPAAGSRAECPAHVHPPPKKCCRSHANTSADVYAAGGSIRLSPKGRKATAS